MIRVAHIFCNSFDKEWTTNDLLQNYFTVGEWMPHLRRAGISATCFFRFHSDTESEIQGTTYYFLKDGLPSQFKRWYLPLSYLKQTSQYLESSTYDVIHLHDFQAVLAHTLLQRLLHSRYQLILQDHGSLPNYKYEWLQKKLFPHFHAFLFAAKGQEKPWLEKKIIKSAEKCHFVMESSSPFTPITRAQARAKSDLEGNPIFLWVGNLDQNKDPITVLTAFQKSKEKYPEATIYMIYKNAPLLSEVNDLINSMSSLRDSVHLLGFVERRLLPFFYCSADYFILGSHKEGSGYSVIEAMSCGVIPIVTNIPSFRALTHAGKVGHLFSPGSVDELTVILQSLEHHKIEEQCWQLQQHFSSYFSFSALAEKMRSIYGQVIGTLVDQ